MCFTAGKVLRLKCTGIKRKERENLVCTINFMNDFIGFLRIFSAIPSEKVFQISQQNSAVIRKRFPTIINWWFYNDLIALTIPILGLRKIEGSVNWSQSGRISPISEVDQNSFKVWIYQNLVRYSRVRIECGDNVTARNMYASFRYFSHCWRLICNCTHSISHTSIN